MAVVSLTALQASAYDYDRSTRTDFRDESIYFIITTRFFDGDPSNNTYCWDGTHNQESHDPEWRGDFQGLIDRLDYIKALGFTAIWMTPIVENASGLDYHGYHAMDFSNVDPRYYDYNNYEYDYENLPLDTIRKQVRERGDAAFERLVKAAHDKGLKIVLDIVLNHTGNFGESKLCDMFYKDYTQNLGEIDSSLKVVSKGDGGKLDEAYGASDYLNNVSTQYDRRLALMKNTDNKNHDEHNYWHHYGNFNWDLYNRWFAQIAGDCVDLNTENPVVADYLVQQYGRFIKMGVDGFRIDTSGHISRATFNHAFIPKFQELAEKYKDARDGGPFFMFGEVCARASEVVYRGQKVLSPFFYTWKEGTWGCNDYTWIDNDPDDTSWDSYVVESGDGGSSTYDYRYLGEHPNMVATVEQGEANDDTSNMPSSSNVTLSGNTYHTPDYSDYSGFSVIDFAMHRRFRSASSAFGAHTDDYLYNDASYNVVYVDSHDYAPETEEDYRFVGSTADWAENMDLMFTFRGIPCLYYGSEIEFKKGCVIDNGTETALINTGRAYYGGYLTGSITANSFGDDYTASGNVAVTLKHPLARHLQQLNKIRANVPALRRGQYSTDDISGSGIAFKRRYTSGSDDSFALVVISGTATFNNLPSGLTFTDVLTGQTYSGTSITLSAEGQGNMRVAATNCGQLIDNGPYIYSGSASNVDYGSYDGSEEAVDYDTPLPDGSTGGTVTEPDEVIEPTLYKGEQAIFFDNSSSNWGGTIYAWVWSTTNSSTNYTGGSWPGQACTYLGNGIWKWSYSGSDTVSGGCIFNNNSSQTGDMTYVNGGVYNSSGWMYTLPETDEDNPNPTTPDVNDDNNTGGTSGSSSDGSTSTTSNSYTVYFSDNYTPAWSTVYIYIWDKGNGDKEYVGGWPGTVMTQKDDQGRWTYTLTTTDTLVNPMVIFDDGNGGGISDQTSDLSLVNYGVYNRDGLQTTETPTGVNAIKAVASEDEWYTLQGVKIEHPLYRGIYIKNGKKVVIR